jgi:hypothetical protein
MTTVLKEEGSLSQKQLLLAAPTLAFISIITPPSEFTTVPEKRNFPLSVSYNT